MEMNHEEMLVCVGTGTDLDSITRRDLGKQNSIDSEDVRTDVGTARVGPRRYRSLARPTAGPSSSRRRRV